MKNPARHDSIARAQQTTNSSCNAVMICWVLPIGTSSGPITSSKHMASQAATSTRVGHDPGLPLCLGSAGLTMSMLLERRVMYRRDSDCF